MVEKLNILEEETTVMLPKLETKMAEWEMEDLRLTDSTFFCFLGRGYCLSCAAEAALLFQELARQPSSWYNGAEFRQGPIEVLRRDHTVFVFAPDGPTRNLNSALLQELRNTGAQVVEVGPAWADIPEHLAAITQIIPAQFAAYRLAMKNKGRLGDFRFAAKTTESEYGTAIGG
jgi:fructoselysine-6-P-deglycase FrlB-like protein